MVELITENLSTLKIHKLTKEQYNRELANGNIDNSAIYLTSDDEVDLDSIEFITVDDIDTICGATIEAVDLNGVTF